MFGTLEDSVGVSPVGEVSLELELDEASKVSQSELVSNMLSCSVKRIMIDIVCESFEWSCHYLLSH